MELVDDVFFHIFAFVDTETLIRCVKLTCKFFNIIVNSPTIFDVIQKRYRDSDREYLVKLGKMAHKMFLFYHCFHEKITEMIVRDDWKSGTMIKYDMVPLIKKG